jgi:hypothetical protein
MLIQICESGAKDRDRIAAGRIILEHGYGRPQQAVTIRAQELSDVELTENVCQILQKYPDQLRKLRLTH